MDIRFESDNIKDLTVDREMKIKEYTELQEKFVEMAKKGVVTYFIINKLQDELDIDNLSEELCKRLDNCKDEEAREHLSKDLPRHDVGYGYLYISPYTIEYVGNNIRTPVDMLDTYIIEAINERIKARLDLYKNI